ncbi:DUF1454 family protein [Moellerella wisconsensis]
MNMMSQLAHRTIRTIITAFIYCLPLLSQAQEIPRLPDSNVEVAYLSPDAPSFAETIPIFREKFNLNNPATPLYEYKVIANNDISTPYIRAATRINPRFYSSAVLERGSEKIKSLQLTLLPSDDPIQAQDDLKLAEQYMIALIHQVDPTIPLDKAPELNLVLKNFMATNNHNQADETRLGAIRYILVKSTDNTLTFAVEPIKLFIN